MNKEVKRVSETDLDSQLEKAVETHVKEAAEDKVVKRNTRKKKTSSSVEVKVNAHPMTKLPEYKTSGAAGLDVYANVTFQSVVKPGEASLIPTGLRVVIPEGYELQVRPRSGLALNKSITVLNTPGTIDSDYRDEVGVILINHGQDQFLVNRHDRIAQLVLQKVEKLEWVKVDNDEFEAILESERNDRQGGFGSTGR